VSHLALHQPSFSLCKTINSPILNLCTEAPRYPTSARYSVVVRHRASSFSHQAHDQTRDRQDGCTTLLAVTERAPKPARLLHLSLCTSSHLRSSTAAIPTPAAATKKQRDVTVPAGLQPRGRGGETGTDGSSHAGHGSGGHLMVGMGGVMIVEWFG